MRKSLITIGLAAASLAAIGGLTGCGTTASHPGALASSPAAAIARLQADHIPGPYQQIRPLAFYSGDHVTSAAQGTSPTSIGAGPPTTMPGTADGPLTEMAVVNATPADAARLVTELSFFTQGAGVNTPWQVTVGGVATNTVVVIGAPAQMDEFDKIALSFMPTPA
jgi:hypothetical protein